MAFCFTGNEEQKQYLNLSELALATMEGDMQAFCVNSISGFINHIVLSYADFAEGYESAASLIGEYENLIVVMTLSKSYSLAGIRMGFAMGSSELIEGLTMARDSFVLMPSSDAVMSYVPDAITISSLQTMPCPAGDVILSDPSPLMVRSSLE